MSDIAIRFDGLLLGAFLAAGAVIFIIIASIAAASILIRKRDKQGAWKVVSRSLIYAAVHSAGLAILIGYITRYGGPATGPDWLDWLALPCLIGSVIALVLVFRARSATKGV